MVGQQPFRQGRASGTNDKAGSALNLLRWTSARSIKETFVPPRPSLHTWGTDGVGLFQRVAQPAILAASRSQVRHAAEAGFR